MVVQGWRVNKNNAYSDISHHHWNTGWNESQKLNPGEPTNIVRVTVNMCDNLCLFHMLSKYKFKKNIINKNYISLLFYGWCKNFHVSCLFVCLIWFLTSQSTRFQLCQDRSSWVEQELSKDKCVLLKDTTQLRWWDLEPGPLCLESSTLPLSHSAHQCFMCLTCVCNAK